MSYRMDERELDLQTSCQRLGHWASEKDDSGEEVGRSFVAGENARQELALIEQLLRRDQPEQQPLFVRMGEWQTIRTHLLPLLQMAPELDVRARAENAATADIGYLCIKVLVRLTLPIAPLVENQLLRLQHLQQAKAWLLEGDALLTLLYLLSEPLAVVQSERNQQQRNMLELGLTLIRNLLAIPDPDSAPNEHARKLHDRCIIKMHEALVLEMLCTLAMHLDNSTETAIKFLLSESFAALFRQEKNVDDLFVGEQEAAKAAQAEQVERAAEEARKAAEGKLASAREKLAAQAATAAAERHASSVFVNGEAARLSANLAAALAAERAQQAAFRGAVSGRHSRFGSKYSVRVVLPSTNYQDPATAASDGPEGEKLRSMTVRHASADGSQLFATRFVRNPFEASAARRNVTDAMALRTGRKAMGSQAPRAFLSIKVKQALHATACQLLDNGGYSLLQRAVLGELLASPTKDVAPSSDTLHYMQLSAFFMHFQRVRSKAVVKEAEKRQRQRDKEDERREQAELDRRAREEAEIKKHLQPEEADASALPPQRHDEAMHGTARVRAPPPAGVSSSGSAPVHSPHSQSGEGEGAPAFPNAVDSQGQFTFATQSQSEEGAASASSLSNLLDDGVDETLVAAAPAAAPAVAAASAAPAAPVAAKRPFVRTIHFDASPLSASLSHDSWKYLTDRIKQYHEFRPVPWTHLAAAVNMFKELLRNLCDMVFYGDVTTRLKADNLRRAIFYDRDAIDLFAELLRHYRSSAASRAYLEDLVAAAHFQMRLLEDLAREGEFTVLERRRTLVRRKKQVKLDIHDPAAKEAIKAAEGAGGAEDGEQPGAADADEEAPKSSASKKKEFLRRARLEEEEGLAMAAVGAAQAERDEQREEGDDDEHPNARRSLFPELTEEQAEQPQEEGVEGAAPLTAAEKAKRALEASRAASALSYSKRGADSAEMDLSADQTTSDSAIAAAAAAEEGEAAAAAEDDDEEYETVEVEEDVPRTRRRESEFDFMKFLIRFARGDIITHYLSLLAAYRDASAEHVLMVLSFFQRLSRAHLDGFFFQLSAFVTFERILTDPWLKAQRVYDELRQWIKSVVRQFIDLATLTRSEVQRDGSTAVVQPNKHLWIELLFWKNMETADKLLNESGWFDRSTDRAKSMRDAQHLDDDEDDEEKDWVDIDEEEEDAKREAKARAEAEAHEAELLPENVLQTGEWQEDDSGAKGRAKSRPWAPNEDALLRANYASFADEADVTDILASMLLHRTAKQVADRLRKLGLSMGRKAPAKPRAPAGEGKASKRGSKKHVSVQVSLFERLERTDGYKLVPSIDVVADELRELVVQLVREDCRAALAGILADLRRCRDLRATASQVDADMPFAPFDFSTAPGESSTAVDILRHVFQVMGIQDKSDDSWTVGPQWTPQHLTEFVDLLEATLDSPLANEEDDDADEERAYGRLVAKQRKREQRMADQMEAAAATPEDDDDAAVEEGEAEYTPARAQQPEPVAEESKEEVADVPMSSEEAEQQARKAAKRAKREAKQLAEAAELAAQAAVLNAAPSQSQSQSQSGPSRRRRNKEEVVAERMQREREVAEERRRRQEEEDAEAEAAYEPQADTALGAAAVEAQRQAERQLASNFANKGLNDYLAQKRKRRDEVFDQRIKAATQSQSQSQGEGDCSPAKRAKATAASSPSGSTPAKSGTKSKRLLRRAAASDSEDDDAPAAASPAAPADDDIFIPETASMEDDSAVPSAGADEDEEQEGAVIAAAPSRKKQQAVRRRIAADDDEDEERAEGEPQQPTAMETDDSATAARVDTQAETQDMAAASQA